MRKHRLPADTRQFLTPRPASQRLPLVVFC